MICSFLYLKHIPNNKINFHKKRTNKLIEKFNGSQNENKNQKIESTTISFNGFQIQLLQLLKTFKNVKV